MIAQKSGVSAVETIVKLETTQMTKRIVSINYVTVIPYNSLKARRRYIPSVVVTKTIVKWGKKSQRSNSSMISLV